MAGSRIYVHGLVPLSTDGYGVRFTDQRWRCPYCENYKDTIHVYSVRARTVREGISDLHITWLTICI